MGSAVAGRFSAVTGNGSDGGGKKICVPGEVAGARSIAPLQVSSPTGRSNAPRAGFRSELFHLVALEPAGAAGGIADFQPVGFFIEHEHFHAVGQLAGDL